METVVLDGINFIKASVVAKRFNYTSDYIGQLCRAKKVDARLVGRTWFVNPDSIIDHKRSKYVSPDTSENLVENADKAINIKPSRLIINSVVRNKTIKSLSNHSEDETKRLKVSYEKDEDTLIPNITRKVLPKPVTLHVDPAGAKKLKIASEKKVYTSFEAEELPDFALSGKLTVEGLQEPDTEEEVEEVEEESRVLESSTIDDNHDISPKISPVTKKLKIIETSGSRNKKIDVQTKNTPSTHSHGASGMGRGSTMSRIRPSNQIGSDSSSREVKFSQTPVNEVQPVKIHFAILMSPAIATVFALAIVATIFSASSNMVVSRTNYESGVVLQMANLLEVFRQQF